MKMLTTNTYRMKDATRDNIIGLGFHYYAPNDDYTHNLYKTTFPVYKHNGRAVTDCELVVEEATGKITINVYYRGTRQTCPPFYGIDDALYRKNYKNIMDKNVEKEFLKLGIEQV